MKTGTPAGGGNGPTAPGGTPVAAMTSGGRATRTSVAPAATADLGRIGAPVAGHERQHRPVLGDEDERLHDLVEIAADRLGSALRRGGGRRELLEARLRARGAKEDGDALDGLGP